MSCTDRVTIIWGPEAIPTGHQGDAAAKTGSPAAVPGGGSTTLPPKPQSLACVQLSHREPGGAKGGRENDAFTRQRFSNI